jgi:hypothetical protein
MDTQYADPKKKVNSLRNVLAKTPEWLLSNPFTSVRISITLKYVKRKISRHTVRQKNNRKGKRKNILRYLFPFFGVFITTLAILTLFFRNIPSKPLATCANTISCMKNVDVEINNTATGIFLGHRIVPPSITLSEKYIKPNVLGDTSLQGEKHIYVDLGKQLLSAYQGDTLVLQTPVSTGRWGKTPTGDFHIWIKLRATRMSGGSGADFYDLPNVPYTMFFYNNEVPKSAGFSLHGAYWHNNFGHTMSHGCVNMRIIDAEKIYNWANPITTGNTTYATNADPGTLVTIYGNAPN